MCVCFLLTAESVGCGGRIVNAQSGDIRPVDINNDGNFENNQDCTWVVTTPVNQVLQLTVTWPMTLANNNCDDQLLVGYLHAIILKQFTRFKLKTTGIELLSDIRRVAISGSNVATQLWQPYFRNDSDVIDGSCAYSLCSRRNVKRCRFHDQLPRSRT